MAVRSAVVFTNGMHDLKDISLAGEVNAAIAIEGPVTPPIDVMDNGDAGDFEARSLGDGSEGILAAAENKQVNFQLSLHEHRQYSYTLKNSHATDYPLFYCSNRCVRAGSGYYSTG